MDDHQSKLAAQNSRLSAIFALPEGIAQYGTLCAAATVVVSRRDQPSQQWLHAKYIEEISAHHQRIGIARLATLTQVVCEGRPCGYFGESLLLLSQPVPDVTGEVGMTRIKIPSATL